MRKILLFGAVALMSMFIAISSYAGEWQGQENGQWKYVDDGNYIVNKWFKDTDNDGAWYHFDENGLMQSNQWAMDGGNWYYLGSDGRLMTNSYTPDGYYVGSDGIWDQSVVQKKPKPEAYSNLVYPVDVISGGFNMNSVGGVDPYVGFRNNSGKVIKYITFEMTPYNRVFDPVSCTIRGYSTRECEATGPFDPDVGICAEMYSTTSGSIFILDRNSQHPYYYTTRTFDKMDLQPEQYAKTFTHFPGWDTVWYNSNIHYIEVTKATIDYMDGTNDVISDLHVVLHYDSKLD